MIKRILTGALALLALALATGPAAAGCTLNFVDLPVTMADLRATIAVKINGAPAVLAVDSGAFYSFISAPSAAALHLPLRAAPPGRDVIRGINGDSEIYLTTVKKLQIGASVLPNLDFTVGGSALGDDVAGLIGQNILARGDVEYDLGHGAMRLVRPTDCGDKMLAYWDKSEPYSVLGIGAISEDADTTTSSVQVNGITMRVLFDTGSPTSFLTLAAAKRAGIDPHGPGAVPAGVTTGVGLGRLATWIAPVKSFKIGDEEIRNTHLRIGDAPLLDRDMLIGADFFLSHHIYVANSQRKLYFTYNGGPVFNLTTQSQAAAPTDNKAAQGAETDPTSAAGFAQRGAALTARYDYQRAIADLSRAITMAPNEPSYAYLRAMAYIGDNQPVPAMADLNRTLVLRPGDLQALTQRAALHLASGDDTLTLADLDSAASLAPKEAEIREELASLYLRVGADAKAIAQLDLWIAAHRLDSGETDALAERCWAKALANQDLRGALGDCNEALRRAPKSAGILDSRGLVRLRMGDLDRSIADYDAALALNPKIAWSLYGRGLARMKKGQAAEGQADVAAAVALQPHLPDEAKAHGLAP